MADPKYPGNRFAPVTLEGSIVRLRPIRRQDSTLLYAAAKANLDEIFRWFPWPMKTADDFERYVGHIITEQDSESSMGFVTTLRESGKVVGSTRCLNIDPANRRLEIGSTWLVREWQRTRINTEAKYLMLRHAFETWGCQRVEFKTDALNQRSRDAILRLGAKEEGTFRKHIVVWDGRIRDSVYYSIVDSEWPEIKIKLEQILDH